MARRIIIVETEERPDHPERLTIGTALRMIEDRVKYGKVPDEMSSYEELKHDNGARIGRFRVIRDD